jgi:hypothetical protein
MPGTFDGGQHREEARVTMASVVQHQLSDGLVSKFVSIGVSDGVTATRAWSLLCSGHSARIVLTVGMCP